MSVFATGSLEVRDSSDNLVLGVGDRHPQPILKGPDSDSLRLGSTVITGSIEVIPFDFSTVSILTGSFNSTGVKVGIGTNTASPPGIALALFGDLGLTDTANAKSIALQASAGGSFTMGSDGNNYGRFEYTEASNSVQIFTRAGGVTHPELMLKNNQVSVGKGSAAATGVDLEVGGANKTVLIGDGANPPGGSATLFLGNKDTKIYHTDIDGGGLAIQSTSSIALVGDRTIGNTDNPFVYLEARNEAAVGITGREDVRVLSPGGLQIDNALCVTGTFDSFGSDQTRATFSHEGAAQVDIMRIDPSIFGNDELGVLNFFGSEDGGVTRSGGASIRAVAAAEYTGVSKATKIDFYISKTATQALGMTLTEERDLQVGGKIKVGGNIIQNGSTENALVFDSGASPKTDVQGKLKISGNEIQDSSGNAAITFNGSTVATVNSGIYVKQFSTAASAGSTIRMSRQPTDETISAGDTLSEIKTIGENAAGQDPVGAIIEVTSVQDWDFTTPGAEKCGSSMAFWATPQDSNSPSRALLINGDNPLGLAITSSVKTEHLDRVTVNASLASTAAPHLQIHNSQNNASSFSRIAFTTGYADDGGRISGFGDDWTISAHPRPTAEVMDARLLFNYSNGDGDGSDRSLMTMAPKGVTGSCGISITQDMSSAGQAETGRHAVPLDGNGIPRTHPSQYALFLQQERTSATSVPPLGTVDPSIGIGFGTSDDNTGAAICYRDVGLYGQGRMVLGVKSSTSDGAQPDNSIEISGDAGAIFSNYVRDTTNGSTSGTQSVRINSITGQLERYTSDGRGKKDVEDLVSNLETVCQLIPKKYRDIKEDENAEKSIGLISQEVEQVIPELVSGKSAPEEVFRGVNYELITMYIVNALKEIKERLEALEG